MTTKRAIKKNILHKMPTKAGKSLRAKSMERSRSADPLMSANIPKKVTPQGKKNLTDEARRMEQNRILRHRFHNLPVQLTEDVAGM